MSTPVAKRVQVDAASNSFSRRQLLALTELCRKARMEPPLRVLMRSPEIIEAEGKMLRMLESIASRANGAKP